MILPIPLSILINLMHFVVECAKSVFFWAFRTLEFDAVCLGRKKGIVGSVGCVKNFTCVAFDRI